MYAYDAFGQLKAEYGTAALTPLCTTCYLATDHLGSTRLVTNQSAAVVVAHDFAPFGQEIPAGLGGRSGVWSASDNLTQKFTGQERDTETALDFFQARYFSGGLGRFMSPDPGNAGADLTNPQSLNGYGYVLGNPLGLVDPSGLDPIYLPCPDCTTTVNGGSAGDINTELFDYATGAIFSVTGYYAPPRPAKTVRTPPLLNLGPPKNATVMPLIGPSDPGNCDEQLQNLRRVVHSVRPSGTNAFKGLAQRYGQLPGYRNLQVLKGHVGAFLNDQSFLGDLIQQYKDSGCGDPPADVAVWETQPLQPGVQQRLDLNKRIAIGAGATATGAAAGWLIGGSLSDWLAGLAAALAF